MLLEPGSYRDRNGVVFYRDGAAFGGISAKALANWERLSAASFFRELTALGSIVATSRTPPELEAQLGSDWAAVLEHARIPFVSYPYEWTFGMLKDAALLHLDLLDAALTAGMILRTPPPTTSNGGGHNQSSSTSPRSRCCLRESRGLAIDSSASCSSIP